MIGTMLCTVSDFVVLAGAVVVGKPHVKLICRYLGMPAHGSGPSTCQSLVTVQLFWPSHLPDTYFWASGPPEKTLY